MLTTELCKKIDNAFWIRTAFFIEHFVHILQKFIKHICSYLYLGEHIDLGAVSSHAQCRSRNEKNLAMMIVENFPFFLSRQVSSVMEFQIRKSKTQFFT